MYKWLIVLSVLFLMTSCSEKTPPPVTEISAVENIAFGGVYPDASEEKHERQCSFLSENDALEIFTTPRSALIWRIAIVAVPPGDGDPVAAVRRKVEEKYSVNFMDRDLLELPGTRIELSRAFERGERAVRCSFTDKKREKTFLDEDRDAQTAAARLIRQAEKDIFLLEHAVKSFREETGVYPGSLQWLIKDPGISSWLGPYLKSIPADPWGNEYRYERTAQGFRIYSTGGGKQEICP